MAVHAGVAEVVVCYRAMNERSQYRFGQAFVPPAVPNAEAANWGWSVPFGLATPASWVAMAARRYMHDFGATSEDFGRVSVACRRHAAVNPHAWFYRQADHACGAPGFALDRRAAAAARLLPGERRGGGDRGDAAPTRARHLRHKPALIRAAAQGATDDQMNMTSFYRRGHLGALGDATGGTAAVRHGALGAAGHPDRGAVRPLLALRAAAAGGVRLLRARGGQGFHPRRQHRDRRRACRSIPTAASSAKPTSTA